MFSDVHKHVTRKLANTVIEKYPYPHLIIDEIFPADFYKQLIKNEIAKESLLNLRDSNRVGTGYSDARYVMNLDEIMPVLDTSIRTFWENFAKWLNYYFKNMLLRKFNQSTTNVAVDALYTKDYQTYKLGPHTDKISKILTCLIYLPEDKSNTKYGTSMYLPKDKSFICKGGPHHKREHFDLYKTIPYEPNKLFCFLKTDNSFHGVESVDSDIERTLLIFDLQKEV